MASAKMDLSGLEAEYQTSQLYLKQIRHMIHLLREQVPRKIHLEGSVHGLIQEVRLALPQSNLFSKIASRSSMPKPRLNNY